MLAPSDSMKRPYESIQKTKKKHDTALDQLSVREYEGPFKGAGNTNALSGTAKVTKAIGLNKSESQRLQALAGNRGFQPLCKPPVKRVVMISIGSCAMKDTFWAGGSTFPVQPKSVPVQRAAEVITLYYIGMTLEHFCPAFCRLNTQVGG